MPRKHLTDLVCQTITVDKQTRYWDSAMPSFGIAVGPRSKTFIVMTGKNRQLVTIGKYPQVGLANARREAHRILGTYRAAETVSFAEARADFIELHCKRNYRPGTAVETARLLNRLSLSGPLNQISRRDIQHAIANFTPSIANHSLKALKTFFNWCVERGVVTTTPLLRAKLPHHSKTRSRTLTDPELARVWAATAELDTYDRIVRLCILLGARRGEVAGIQPAWVQQDTLLIPIESSKNKREHSLPLSPQCLSLLESCPFSTNSWSKNKARLDRLGGVSDWTLHDLRRTFATIHAKIGTAPHIIEALLNHVSGQISGVAAIYNRYQYADEKRAALRRYDKYLSDIFTSHSCEAYPE